MHPRIFIVFCAALLALGAVGCDDESNGEEENPYANVPDIGAGVDFMDIGGEPEDVDDPEPDPEPVPEDDALTIDVIREDAFVRPDPEPTPEPQPDPEPEMETFTEVRGTVDCLEYRLRAQSTVFTLKEDIIGVTYQITNTCQRTLRMRTQHESDFFSVGITKNGEPWIFLPDCPGRGAGRGAGLQPRRRVGPRVALDPDDHEERQMRCGVTYDRDADYAIIGYGLDPVQGVGDWSNAFPITDPIPITLVQ